MKKSHKIPLFVFCICLEFLQLLIVFSSIAFFTATHPITAEMLIEAENYSKEPYTYSVKSKTYETPFEYNERSTLRKFLLNLTLIAPTPHNVFSAGNRNTINIYMNGIKHSITFKGYKSIFGYKIGFVDYDGQEYIVDNWINEYGNLLCYPYRQQILIP